MKRYLLIAPLMLFAAVSCYKEAPIHSEPDAPEYVIQDSDDPNLHYIYEMYSRNGVYVLYEYEDSDYLWDVSSQSNNVLVRLDKADVGKAVEHARKTLFDLYDDDFIRGYFPYRVFLADSVNNSMYKLDVFKDRICSYGRSYLALGRLSADNFPFTPEAELEYRGKVNGMLWGDILYSNRLVDIPDGFFSPCSEYYGKSGSQLPDKDDPASLKRLGFWSYDEFNMGNDYMYPSQEGDVSDFVEMITTHTSEEMNELMSGYENLVIKYNILVNAVRENYGVDLQEIGNNK